MKYHKRQSKPFYDLVERHRDVMPEIWYDDLHNYIILGFEPGRFHGCLYANDLNGAAISSDSFNEWPWIRTFMGFLARHAPPECWGNRDKMNKWLKLNNTVRYKICHQHGLILTPQEATWSILENSE